MRHVYVAPSILSADFSRIEEEVAKAAASGAEFLHLDVMDGIFVPKVTFGPDLVERVIPYAGKMVRDMHLMVADPMKVAKGFVEAGADIITFHYESYADDESRWSCLRFIRSLGAKVGMAVSPSTPAAVLDTFLSELDLVLIMSVVPGKGGQLFLPCALEKLSYVRQKIDALGMDILLEVDGGVNEETAKQCVQAGADILVAGSYLYRSDDFEDRVRRIRG